MGAAMEAYVVGAASNLDLAIFTTELTKDKAWIKIFSVHDPDGRKSWNLDEDEPDTKPRLILVSGNEGGAVFSTKIFILLGDLCLMCDSFDYDIENKNNIYVSNAQCFELVKSDDKHAKYGVKYVEVGEIEDLSFDAKIKLTQSTVNKIENLKNIFLKLIEWADGEEGDYIRLTSFGKSDSSPLIKIEKNEYKMDQFDFDDIELIQKIWPFRTSFG
jgi:hypothetical protein